MEIKIRKATLQDCEAMCEIHVSSIRELGKSHYSKAEIDAWSRGRTPKRYQKHISESYVIIAEHKGAAVGFGTLDPRAGEIVQLYIQPEYARKSIGAQILEELFTKALGAGHHEVYLIASLNAEAFYSKAGFESGPICKHQFHDGGEVDCIPMKKRLGS
jgi:putative acetyltransferase